MSDILFMCPKCKQPLAVDSASAGCDVECAACGGSTTIPTPDTAWLCESCGASLSTSSIPVGEAIGCPCCGSQTCIPPETQGERPRLRLAAKCPSCKAPLPSDTVICVSCGFDRRTGKRHEAVLTVPLVHRHARGRLEAKSRGNPVLTLGMLLFILAVVGIGGYLYWRKPTKASNDEFAAAMRQTQTGTAESAVNALKQFVDRHPHARQTALAQARLSVLSSQIVAATYATAFQQADGLGSPKEAMRALEVTVKRFPEAPQAGEARQMITHIQEIIRQDDEMEKAISSAKQAVARNALAEAKTYLEAAIREYPTASAVARASALLMDVVDRVKSEEESKSEREANSLLMAAAEEAAKDNLAGAEERCRKAAALGSANARNLLGTLLWGDGNTTQEWVEAYALFSAAADQGWQAAQKNMGMCRLIGRGCEKEAVEAVRWFRKAAENGNAEAMGWTGYCLLTGQGVAPDAAEAAKWYARSAAAGCTKAEYVMGVLCLDGKGVAQDTTRATVYFEGPARNDHVMAGKSLACIYAAHEGTRIYYANSRAVYWATIVACQGDAEARSWIAKWMQAVNEQNRVLAAKLGKMSYGMKITLAKTRQEQESLRKDQVAVEARAKKSEQLRFAGVFPHQPSRSNADYVPSDGFVYPWGLNEDKRQLEWNKLKCPDCGGSGYFHVNLPSTRVRIPRGGTIITPYANETGPCRACHGTGIRQR
jgi:TPR repeat protein